MMRLYQWMSSPKHTFSMEMQLYFAAGFHSHSGGSNRLVLNLVACSYRALIFEMGIPEEMISNIMIA
jgi:hypothetical protein